MQYTINELRDKVYENVHNVYQVFKDYFGEEFVDIQNYVNDIWMLSLLGITESQLSETDITDDRILYIRDTIRNNAREGGYPFILVYWPRVTVTNENNKFVDIQDLYAKITLTIDGYIPYEYTFQLNRATYTKVQFKSDYMFSHIPGIPCDDFSKFLNPCLGTGPIKQTVSTLHESNDEVAWMLFCRELSLYVTVESLTGGPYRKLEQIGLVSVDSCYYGFNLNGNNSLAVLNNWVNAIGKDGIDKFIKYYLQNGHLSFSYKDNGFTCGMAYYDFIIDISNSFIEYFNAEIKSLSVKSALFSKQMLNKRIVVNQQFCYKGESHRTDWLERSIGKHVCYFKGQDIRLSIIDTEEDSTFETTLLNQDAAMEVLTRILNVINYRYKNERNKQNAKEESAASYRKVRYI